MESIGVFSRFPVRNGRRVGRLFWSLAAALLSGLVAIMGWELREIYRLNAQVVRVRASEEAIAEWRQDVRDQLKGIREDLRQVLLEHNTLRRR